MRRLLSVCLLLAFAVPALGATTYFVYDLNGGQGVTHDPDKPPPTVGTKLQGFYAEGASPDYTSIRFNPDNFVGGPPLILSSITRITYDSKNLGGEDWRVKVYTKPSLVTKSTHPNAWYGHRLNFYPSPDVNSKFVTTTLDYDTTYESLTRFGFPSTFDGNYYDDVVLSQYAGNEEVLFIDVSLGYATDGPSYNSAINNVTVDTIWGSFTLTANAPEPSMAMIGCVGMGLLRRGERGG